MFECGGPNVIIECALRDKHVICMTFNLQMMDKSKLFPYLIMSIGYRADPGFLAVSVQVTLVINFVVGIYT